MYQLLLLFNIPFQTVFFCSQILGSGIRIGHHRDGLCLFHDVWVTTGRSAAEGDSTSGAWHHLECLHAMPGGWGLGPQVGLSFWSTSVLLGVIPCGLGFLRHGGLSLSHFIRGRSGPQVWLFHWKRWKVHCFLWPSLGGHVVSPLLYSGLKHLQAHEFSRGGGSDYLWVEEWKAPL